MSSRVAAETWTSLSPLVASASEVASAQLLILPVALDVVPFPSAQAGAARPSVLAAAALLPGAPSSALGLADSVLMPQASLR